MSDGTHRGELVLDWDPALALANPAASASGHLRLSDICEKGELLTCGLDTPEIFRQTAEYGAVNVG